MQHERRCSHTRGEDVSFRDVKIKIPDRKYDQRDLNDVMHRKRARRILEIWEKSESWVLASEEHGWLSELAEALRRVPHVIWRRWKSQHREMVSLSLCRKTFKLKGNKKFRTWTKCFLCFGILMLYKYELWTFYLHFPYPYSCMAMLHTFIGIKQLTRRVLLILVVRLVVWTPVFSSHPRPCGHFIGCTKIKTKQQTEGERKKQTNTDLEL